jgi:hypothetical protein
LVVVNPLDEIALVGAMVAAEEGGDEEEVSECKKDK